MPDPQYLHHDHATTGTQVVVHLDPAHLEALADFVQSMPGDAVSVIGALGLSVLIELEPAPLSQTWVGAAVKLKPGLVASWTPPLLTAPAQVMPLYYPDPLEKTDG